VWWGTVRCAVRSPALPRLPPADQSSSFSFSSSNLGLKKLSAFQFSAFQHLIPAGFRFQIQISPPTANCQLQTANYFLFFSMSAFQFSAFGFRFQLRQMYF